MERSKVNEREAGMVHLKFKYRKYNFTSTLNLGNKLSYRALLWGRKCFLIHVLGDLLLDQMFLTNCHCVINNHDWMSQPKCRSSKCRMALCHRTRRNDLFFTAPCAHFLLICVLRFACRFCTFFNFMMLLIEVITCSHCQFQITFSML